MSTNTHADIEYTQVARIHQMLCEALRLMGDDAELPFGAVMRLIATKEALEEALQL